MLIVNKKHNMKAVLCLSRISTSELLLNTQSPIVQRNHEKQKIGLLSKPSAHLDGFAVRRLRRSEKRHHTTIVVAAVLPRNHRVSVGGCVVLVVVVVVVVVVGGA